MASKKNERKDMSTPDDTDTKEKRKADEPMLAFFHRKYVVPWYQSKQLSAGDYNNSCAEKDFLVAAFQKTNGKAKIYTRTNRPAVQHSGNKDKTRQQPISVSQTPVPPSLFQSKPSSGQRATEQRENTDITYLRNKLDKRKQDIQYLNETLADKDTVIQRLHDTAKGEITRIELQKLLEENTKLKRTVTENTNCIANFRMELDSKQDRIDRLRAQLQDLTATHEDMKLRFSKVAGEALRRNNPNITDLSDPNRPTEIKTKFSSLYDDAWSDAFEALPKGEEKNIKLLCFIAEECYKHCRETFDRQSTQVTKMLLESKKEHTTALEVSTLKNILIDFRKEKGPQVADKLAKDFVETELTKFLAPCGLETIPEKLKSFSRQCVRLSWLMNVCDPPVYLTTISTGEKFDTAAFKAYTKTVKGMVEPVIDFIVWPALYLHEDGPLLDKGVAQPKDLKPRGS